MLTSWPGGDRCLRIVRMTPALFMDLLRLDGTRRLRFTGLPADARFAGIEHEVFKNELAVLVESPSFSEVLPGDIVPELTVQCELLESEDATPDVTIQR